MNKLIILTIILIFSSPQMGTANTNCESKIELGKNGWLFRSKTDYRDDFIVDELLSENLKTFQNALKIQNIELVIALLPTRGTMASDEVLNESYNVNLAQESYLKVVQDIKDIGLHVTAIDDFSIDEFYHKTDHHWSPVGAQMMAIEVAEVLKAIPVYNDIPLAKYKTNVKEGGVLRGSFSKILKEDCGVVTEDEGYQNYEIYPVKTVSLLEDIPKAEIVLIGTSNSDKSASKTNFEGFLKQYSSRDVMNYSISGGGHDSAMLRYLVSDEFKQQKPKIIIWEFPIYQDFKNPSFYQQVIPAVYGSCVGEPVFKQTVHIEDQEFKVMIPKTVSAPKSYLHLDISEFDGDKLRANITYRDGVRTSFDFERSKFYEPDGQFFLNLDAGKQVKEITGLLPKGNYSDINVSLCSYSE